MNFDGTDDVDLQGFGADDADFTEEVDRMVDVGDGEPSGDEADLPEALAGNDAAKALWSEMTPEVRGLVTSLAGQGRQGPSESDIGRLADAIARNHAQPPQPKAGPKGEFDDWSDDDLRSTAEEAWQRLQSLGNLPEDEEQRAEAIKAATGWDTSKLRRIQDELTTRTATKIADERVGKLESKLEERDRIDAARQKALQVCEGNRNCFTKEHPVYKGAQKLIANTAEFHKGNPSQGEMIAAFQASYETWKAKKGGGAQRVDPVKARIERAQKQMQRQHKAEVAKAKNGDMQAGHRASQLALRMAFLQPDSPI